MKPKVTVTTKNLSISARKLRLVADLIRGMKVEEALDTLKFTNKKAAGLMLKSLKSGVANAENNNGWKSGSLKISHVSIDEGPTRKSGRWASRGRGVTILKRSAHINLELTRIS